MGAGVGLVVPAFALVVGGVAAEWQRSAKTQEHRAIEAKSSALLEMAGTGVATVTARLVFRDEGCA
jgi:hypothetical protein